MMVSRRGFGLGLAALAAMAMPLRAQAAGDAGAQVMRQWYRLMLELVRHTPTYSPPVASRAFAYTARVLKLVDRHV